MQISTTANAKSKIFPYPVLSLTQIGLFNTVKSMQGARMNPATTKLTYHDYVLLPDDGKQYKVLDGDLFVTPSPVTRHQLIVGPFLQHLMSYLETHPIGTVFTAPYDAVLSDTDIIEPDLLLVLNNSRAAITKNNVQGPPDMILEVLSPSTAAPDRDLKR